MCGIVAMIGINGNEADMNTVDRMSHSIKHRGPDSSGRLIDGPVGFGFQRLSILDLTSSGDQPMYSLDGEKVIIFNGEIYNYIEIRKELESFGYSFRSSGDTEVLLNAYCEWGADCLHRLNGMWAFLIYDKKEKKIFGSRDRFGIKPLYKYKSKDYFFFASEIKAIVASRKYTPTPDWHVAAKYLLMHKLDDEDQTFWSEIERVPAGSAFEFHLNGDYKEWSYWSLKNQIIINNDPYPEFLEMFKDAVKIRLRSDVPVGICLSGGMDSTSIISMMARQNGFKGWGNHDAIEAFCFMAEEFDESKYIEETLAQTGARLNKMQKGPVQLWEDLAKVLWYHDEPVHTLTAVIGFELFQLAAANGVKVVLNGQGADEYLAGYDSYFNDYWYTMLRQGRLMKLFPEILDFCDGHEKSVLFYFYRAFKHLFRTELNRLLLYRKLKDTWNRDRLTTNNPWFQPELINCLRYENSRYEDRSLNARLEYSVNIDPLPLYLRIEDRNSMANSLEARLPFMDYRLISFISTLPYDMKIRGKWNKHILRESMKGYIPETVRTRVDKMGFPFPANKWFSDALYDITKDIIESKSFQERGIFNTKKISEDLETHRRGDKDISLSLFSVLQFEMWMKNLGCQDCYPVEKNRTPITKTNEIP